MSVFIRFVAGKVGGGVALVLFAATPALARATGNAHDRGEVYELLAGPASGLKKGIVVALLTGGVAFLDAKLQAVRVYRHQAVHYRKREETRHVVVADVDKDGEPDVLIVGRPTFLLDGKGDAKFEVRDLCHEAGLFKLEKEGRMGIACGFPGGLAVFRWDGQLAWEFQYKGTPARFRFEDHDGDGVEDVELEILGKEKRVFRLSGSDGKLIGDYETRQKKWTNAADEEAAWRQRVARGKEPLDLGEAGKAILRLKRGRLQVRGEGGTTLAEISLPGKKIHALRVADVMGNGDLKILIGAHRKVFLLSTKGGVKVEHEADLDLRDFRREGDVKVEAIHYQGYPDDGTIQKKVFDRIGDVKGCYDQVLQEAAIARQGKVMLEIGIGSGGRVTSSEQVYSTLELPAAMSCILSRARKWKFPKPEGGKATVNLTLQFTWKDRLGK